MGSKGQNREQVVQRSRYVFIDLYARFQENGGMNPRLTYDWTHLNYFGYQMWYSLIRPYLHEGLRIPMMPATDSDGRRPPNSSQRPVVYDAGKIARRLGWTPAVGFQQAVKAMLGDGR
jgi:hypothetical protein